MVFGSVPTVPNVSQDAGVPIAAVHVPVVPRLRAWPPSVPAVTASQATVAARVSVDMEAWRATRSALEGRPPHAQDTVYVSKAHQTRRVHATPAATWVTGVVLRAASALWAMSPVAALSCVLVGTHPFAAATAHALPVLRSLHALAPLDSAHRIVA